jgi:hypothetical protein
LATTIVYLKGKIKWCKHYKPDVYAGQSFWSHTLYPDDESLTKIKELQAKGLKNHLKKDDDGYYMTFRRYTEKEIHGRKTAFPPPIIVNKDSLPLPPDTMVGNGSDVTIKLSVYTHRVGGLEGGSARGKAIAARWEAIRIDNLVPFERVRDFDENEKKQIGGLEDQPPQLF